MFTTISRIIMTRKNLRVVIPAFQQRWTYDVGENIPFVKFYSTLSDVLKSDKCHANRDYVWNTCRLLRFIKILK